MKTQNRTKVYTNRFQGAKYVLGDYRFYWVAWLRGFAYTVVNINRAVFLDRYTRVTVKRP